MVDREISKIEEILEDKSEAIIADVNYEFITGEFREIYIEISYGD